MLMQHNLSYVTYKKEVATDVSIVVLAIYILLFGNLICGSFWFRKV